MGAWVSVPCTFGCTTMSTVSSAESPSLSVTVSSKRRGVSVATYGAVKRAREVLAPASRTRGPSSWAH